MTVKPLVVSYETAPDHPGLKRLEQSLTKWGWDFHCIVEPRWLGFGRKFKAVAAYCHFAAAAGYSHVVSIDARDFLCVGPVAEFVPPPVPLQFSCEMAAWPDQNRGELHPPCPHPWRYTHSPFCIDLNHLDLLQEKQLRDHDDDQRHATTLFLNSKGDVGLDYDCRLVQSIAFAHPWQQWFEIEGNRLRNRVTGSRPLFLHSNGKTDDSWWQPLIDWSN